MVLHLHPVPTRCFYLVASNLKQVCEYFSHCRVTVSTALYNDLWLFQPAIIQWTLLSPAGSLPMKMYGATAQFDKNSNIVFMFGGYGFLDTVRQGKERNI